LSGVSTDMNDTSSFSQESVRIPTKDGAGTPQNRPDSRHNYLPVTANFADDVAATSS
jgi:hypothetical protein